MVSDFEGQWS